MKYFFCYAFLMMVIVANAQEKQKKQFVLQGTVLNQKEGWLYLSYMDKEGKYVRDSAALKNGTFQFKGYVDAPTMASFNGKMQTRDMDDPNYTMLFIEPTVMKIRVSENDFKNAVLSGSKTQLEYESLQKPLNKIRDRWKVVMDTLTAVNKTSNVQYQELKNWVLRPYEIEANEIYRSFLTSHPTSYVSPMALMSIVRELSSDSITMYYSRFPEPVKNTAYGKIVKQELERRKIGIPGTVASNFTTTDINGNKLSLADYKGKYVLIDFWASWCVPCRKGNPHLLSLYAKFKDKGFEIIGISDDDGNPEAWKKAVEKDGIGVWKHVLRGLRRIDGPAMYDKSASISDRYGISTLPTKVLIDPNGVIVGRYGDGSADDEAMDKKLSEIFGG